MTILRLSQERRPSVDIRGMTPQLSILIPNFNNGRQSTTNGQRDLIGDLFESLRVTLTDDPTALEIIVADDGSTDDSLDTCRAWGQKTWGGWRREQPFLRLIELEHCGVLSRVANRLTGAARGEICCRLDGDIICTTPNWAGSLVETFEQGPPDLGIVGPMQLGMDGFIHSFGSWILHPRGHHHVAQGAPPQTVTRAMEVDHVMGCFYCHRRSIWEELGGYDETILRGQTVDFGLGARLRGWRAFAVPHIRFVHCHAARTPRSNEADSDDGIELTLDRFTRKWGFDRLAPDLDAVADRYRGTPLVWNARVFGPRATVGSHHDVAQSAWGRFAQQPAFRQAALSQVELIELACTDAPTPRQALQVGCGTGLIAHLLAKRGWSMVGVDRDPAAIDLAQRMAVQDGSTEAAYLHQAEERRLPVEDACCNIVLLIEAMERHHNPIGLLREAHRALLPNGLLFVVTRERSGPFADDFDALHAYRAHELVLQIQGSRCFAPIPVTLPDQRGALALVARRREADDRGFKPRQVASERQPVVVGG